MDTTSTKENASTVETKDEEKALTQTPEDPEARIKALEDERIRLIGDNANYKIALAKKKNQEDFETPEDERMKRIAQEAISESRVVEIAQEIDAINRKVLRENKELKLALQNKTQVPSSTGTSSETTAVVKDHLITPEMAAYFKQKGWDDKKIERYKRNLQNSAR